MTAPSGRWDVTSVTTSPRDKQPCSAPSKPRSIIGQSYILLHTASCKHGQHRCPDHITGQCTFLEYLTLSFWGNWRKSVNFYSYKLHTSKKDDIKCLQNAKRLYDWLHKIVIELQRLNIDVLLHYICITFAERKIVVVLYLKKRQKTSKALAKEINSDVTRAHLDLK